MSYEDTIAVMSEALERQEVEQVENLTEWLDNAMLWIDESINEAASAGSNHIKVETIPEYDGQRYQYDAQNCFLSLPLGDLMPDKFYARGLEENGFMRSLIFYLGNMYMSEGYRVDDGNRTRPYLGSGPKGQCYDVGGGYVSPYVMISWGER